jgi:uncharacterized protein
MTNPRGQNKKKEIQTDPLPNFGYLGAVTKPKLIVQGTEDVYGPRDQVEALFAAMPEPKQIHWVEGADHFFAGRLEEVQAAIREFLTGLGSAEG